MRQHGKRYRKDIEKRPNHALPVEQAVKALKGYSKPKFDQSIDIVFHLGIDPKQADQLVRGSVSLPKGIGASKKVIAFCPETEIEKAKAAGAIEAGADELVDKVSKGWLDFDVAIAHPSLMGKVGKLGKVLGPQGKMPSPKSGTVTADIGTAVKEYAAGKVEFRNDANGNVHAVVGKLSFSEDDLKENISAFMDHIRRMKPSTSKGVFMKKVAISGSMSPSVELELGQHAEAGEEA
ncbi:MAG: 50S ribosomal protein L1 [Planctomycetes bacterium]|nr:50S ribosomal protein L1 [Planctomycetota bacterium]